jgi:hypothetical protein
MSCVHLKKLYALCEEEGMKISSGELVRIVCTQCGEQEVCPTLLVEQYDALHPSQPTPAGTESTADPTPTTNKP